MKSDDPMRSIPSTRATASPTPQPVAHRKRLGRVRHLRDVAQRDRCSRPGLWRRWSHRSMGVPGNSHQGRHRMYRLRVLRLVQYR
jgi:hypothetical protein